MIAVGPQHILFSQHGVRVRVRRMSVVGAENFSVMIGRASLQG